MNLFAIIICGTTASYFLTREIGEKVPLKLKKVILNTSFYFALGIFIYGLYGPVTVQTPAFTFSSIYFGFWLASKEKEFEERKKIRVYLGLLWHEAVVNIHQLDLAKKNFGFYLDDPIYLEMAFIKFSNTYSLVKMIKTSVHDAFLSSGAVSNIPSDEVFNAIEIAYSDLKYVESFFQTVYVDFQTKVRIYKTFGNTEEGKKFEKAVIKDIKKKIKKTAQELAIAYRTMYMAKAEIDATLNKYFAKMELDVLRESILTKEDKSFVENVIQEELPPIPENLFED